MKKDTIKITTVNFPQ